MDDYKDTVYVKLKRSTDQWNENSYSYVKDMLDKIDKEGDKHGD